MVRLRALGDDYMLTPVSGVVGVLAVYREGGPRLGFIQRWPPRAIPASNDDAKALELILSLALDASIPGFGTAIDAPPKSGRA
jgi:hypothetical protein